jgi:protein-S-isoprenylcysteine O-methyltransferase Ste14
VSNGLLLAGLFTLGWIPHFVYRTEALTEAFESYSRSERCWVIAAPSIIAAHTATSCITLSLAATIPPWRAALSVVVFTSGVAFWLWGRRAIAPYDTRRLPDEPPIEFRRDGPFGLVRNPLYFGTMLAAAAPVVAAAEPFLLVPYSACLVALRVRAEQEERRLHQQLGRVYAEYCNEVKRLIPFLW